MKIVYVHSFDEFYNNIHDRKDVEELIGKVFVNPKEHIFNSGIAKTEGWDGLTYILGDKQIPIHERYCSVKTLDSYLEDTEF